MSKIIFTVSLFGLIINKNNLISIIICIEIMLISISLNFLLSSFFSENLISQIMVVYIITIAAVESAIGLSIIITYYKITGTISIKSINTLRG